MLPSRQLPSLLPYRRDQRRRNRAQSVASGSKLALQSKKVSHPLLWFYGFRLCPLYQPPCISEDPYYTRSATYHALIVLGSREQIRKATLSTMRSVCTNQSSTLCNINYDALASFDCPVLHL